MCNNKNIKYGFLSLTRTATKVKRDVRGVLFSLSFYFYTRFVNAKGEFSLRHLFSLRRTVYKNNGTWSSPMRVWRIAHILPNHCGPGRCSICDLAKYTVSLFGRNCCLLYTISVVCHINLTNGWMTVLLPCQIDTRQGLQVLYVIVGKKKPLVCWRNLNNAKRVARNRIFFIWNNFLKFHVISIHVVLAFTQTYMYLCPYLKSWGGARFSPTQISSAMFDTGPYVFTPLLW